MLRFLEDFVISTELEDFNSFWFRTHGTRYDTAAAYRHAFSAWCCIVQSWPLAHSVWNDLFTDHVKANLFFSFPPWCLHRLEFHQVRVLEHCECASRVSFSDKLFEFILLLLKHLCFILLSLSLWINWMTKLARFAAWSLNSRWRWEVDHARFFLEHHWLASALSDHSTFIAFTLWVMLQLFVCQHLAPAIGKGIDVSLSNHIVVKNALSSKLHFLSLLESHRLQIIAFVLLSTCGTIQAHVSGQLRVFK